MATGYTGTVSFSSTDAKAVLPANYPFGTTNAGTQNFFVTFETSGTQSITATDTSTASITGSASTTVNASTSAVWIARNTTTEGNWIGVYGSDGYDVINNPSTTHPNALPAGVTVTPAGATAYTWANPSTATPALDVPGGASRIAACWYASTSFTVDVDVTNGQSYDLELYLLDYNGGNGRSEQIQLSNAGTGAVLSTETVSDFTNGAYLNWTISGNVLITITKAAGANAVLSGLFFDPAPTSKSTPTIAWANPANIVYGTTLSSTQLDAMASVPGTFTYTPAAGTVLKAGNAQTLSVTFTPTDTTDYTTATATAVINVLRATPTITWANPAPITAGTALSGTQLDATASWTVGGVNGSVAGTFTYTPAAGTVLAVGNNQTLSVSFTPTDTTDFTSATATVTINVLAAPPSATFLEEDTKTQGNWIGVYGTDGYEVINNPSTSNPNSLPSGVTITPTGATAYTWANPSTATPALEVPGGASRIAATWYASTSFTVDVDVTNGQSYNLELYVLDYNGGNARSEQIQLSNAGTGAVLSTETVSDFTNGAYLNWTISGNVLITITKTAGANAVLSGLFFDPATTSKSTPTITWANPANIVYGTALSSTQLDATASVPGTFTYTPAAGTVLKAGNGQTLSVIFTPTDTTDYSTVTDTATINVSQATPTITWANPAPITAGTALSGTQLDATSSWTVGGVNGSVAGTFTYTPAAGTVLAVGNNQPLSVIFTPTDTTDYTSATASVTINVLAAPPSATFLEEDTKTQGNWIGVYGSDGYEVINNPSTSNPNSLPSGVTITPAGATTYTWANPSTATPALEVPGGASRIAACWYASTSFTVDVDVTINQSYNLELYFLDYNGGNARSEQIQLSNAGTGAVLSTETVSDFTSGAYLNWTISGNVLITITKTAGANAVLSGLFFDSATTSESTPTITWAKPANVVYGTALSGTQLDATASVPGTFTYTPAAGTVLKAGNAQTLSVKFTPTNTTDYSTATATAVINVLQARPTITWANPAPITSGTALSGTQLDATASWTVGGVNRSVPGTFTYTPAAGTVLAVGNNQTLSVSFTPTDTTDFTSATATVTINVLAAPPSATFLEEDTKRQGNWIGVYGTDGYEVINNPSTSNPNSLPSGVTITPTGATAYTWANPSTATPALEVPGGASRIAATWYASTSFTVDVDVTNSQSYNLELYVLDYNGGNARSEQIQLSNAGTGAVLSTETVSDFTNGAYLNWTISGNVLITITKTAGANAVLSGLFFDPVSITQSTTAWSVARQAVAMQTEGIGSYGSPAATAIDTLEFDSNDSQPILLDRFISAVVDPASPAPRIKRIPSIIIGD